MRIYHHGPPSRREDQADRAARWGSPTTSASAQRDQIRDRSSQKAGSVGRSRGFNLHAASVAGAEDQPARQRLLRYVVRPRFAARQRAAHSPARPPRAPGTEAAVSGWHLCFGDGRALPAGTSCGLGAASEVALRAEPAGFAGSVASQEGMGTLPGFPSTTVRYGGVLAPASLPHAASPRPSLTAGAA